MRWVDALARWRPFLAMGAVFRSLITLRLCFQIVAMLPQPERRRDGETSHGRHQDAGRVLPLLGVYSTLTEAKVKSTFAGAGTWDWALPINSCACA